MIGELWGGCLEIRYLWVHEDRRGLRLAAARGGGDGSAGLWGCTQVMLDTFSFQAPAFYQQHGYTIRGAIEDFPRGHRKYILQKPL